MKNKYFLLFCFIFYVQSKTDTGTFFTTQYDRAVAGVWGNLESVSGPGSTLEQTKTLCARLPGLLKKYAIASIIDAPCGDFNWMRTVPLNNCNYLGLEVVQELIQKNVKLYTSMQHTFSYCDLLQDEIPCADLIISRDFLVHLSNSDVEKALRNFKLSGSKYLLTTTFVTRTNRDIESGDWRPINLQQPPFNLPAPLLVINENCSEQNGQYNDKSMALWKLEDIKIS